MFANRDWIRKDLRKTLSTRQSRLIWGACYQRTARDQSDLFVFNHLTACNSLYSYSTQTLSRCEAYLKFLFTHSGNCLPGFYSDWDTVPEGGNKLFLHRVSPGYIHDHTHIPRSLKLPPPSIILFIYVYIIIIFICWIYHHKWCSGNGLLSFDLRSHTEQTWACKPGHFISSEHG